MDWLIKQRSKSSRHDKTTLKKRREKATIEARNMKSNRTEANLVRSCSELSLSDSGADEENVSTNRQRGRRSWNIFRKTKGVGKKSQLVSPNRYWTRSTQSTQSTRPSSIIKQDVYIQIPLSVMSGKESTSNKNQLISHEDVSPSSPVEGQKYEINYKLTEGFPSYAEEKIRKRKSYVMSYDTETKNAEWVYEILNECTLGKKCKEHMSFGRNELENADYQQGHLAAAANHRWCQEAYHDTYLMSNMIPQLSALNQGMWKILEDYCRSLAEPGCHVHVYTGPLYLRKKGKYDYDRVSKKSTDKKKVIPSHLFKVVFVEHNDGKVEEPECYVMPNEKREYDAKLKEKIELKEQAEIKPEELLKLFKESIEDTQKWSGLTFIKHEPQDKDTCIKQMTWTGEDKNGDSCHVIWN